MPSANAPGAIHGVPTALQSKFGGGDASAEWLRFSERLSEARAEGEALWLTRPKPALAAGQ